jgi:ribosome modulation factor
LQGKDMRVWDEGVEAGEVFKIPCPYEQGTREESDWLDGWLEGSARTLGLPSPQAVQKK